MIPTPMRTKPGKICFSFALIVFLLIASIGSAQNSAAGLSGSLAVNRQDRFYKDPNKAFLLAFFPGFLIHGEGHFYAGDQLMGNVLLTGEVVSVLSIGLGALIKSDPNTFSGGLLGPPTNSNTVGDNLIWGGIIAYLGLWIVDMAHAPTAATEYNNEYQLKPFVSFEQNHPNLSLAYRF